MTEPLSTSRLDEIRHHIENDHTSSPKVWAARARELVAEIDRRGAALEKARADALEEAKSACLDLTGSDATPTLRPGARMCVQRIDHHARVAALAAAGYDILKRTHRAERDWPEDSGHENGNYHCICVTCGRGFTGHKRRVVCRSCALTASEQKP